MTMKTTLKFASLLLLPALITGCPGDDVNDDEIGATDTDTADTTTESTTTDTTTTTTTDTTDATTTDTTDATTDTTDTTETTDGPPPPIIYPDAAFEDYVRVDRMGMPAIATAVITSKDEYNAADPVDDAMMPGPFTPEILANLGALHSILDDDLIAQNLVPATVAQAVNQAGPLIIPDTLKIDLDFDAGFPNGRRLVDPVMGVTLSVILLDLGVMGQTPLSLVPVVPDANDVPFSDTFPYLADPH